MREILVREGTILDYFHVGSVGEWYITVGYREDSPLEIWTRPYDESALNGVGDARLVQGKFQDFGQCQEALLEIRNYYAEAGYHIEE